VAEVIRKPTTINVIKGSARPYIWVVFYAGLLEYLIPNNTKKEAKISVVDSIASAISAYELQKSLPSR
jgi:hypothetical protein